MVAVPILKASADAIDKAGALLRAGELVAFPTETVYGLGADATNGRAVAAIFAAKGRPRFNPLIVHVPDLAAAERLAVFPALALRLAQEFWPGPLTLVLRRRADSGLSDLVSAGLDTVAIRVPDHPVARALLTAAGVPVAAPSANRSGHVSATTAQHVAADFGEVGSDPSHATDAMGSDPSLRRSYVDRDGRCEGSDPSSNALTIIDGGPTAHGLESTVLDATGDHIVMLRPGAVPAEAIEAVLGANIARAFDGGARPVSPGQLVSHYAPRARLRLEAKDVQPGEALLAFGDVVPPTAGPMINLSPTGDLIEAAANLFAALRQLDASGAAAIAVMPIPAYGLGEAINDRLKRAATPRS